MAPGVLCELSILTSSFINTRFFPGRAESVPSAWKPRDEPPFIDTDLARGTIMLTRDDFMFLLDERGLPVPPHPSSTSHRWTPCRHATW